MAVSSAQDAEIKRKASQGITLTNPTKETTALYNQYKTAPASAAKTLSSGVVGANKTTPVYGSNIANFDKNNTQQVALADSGQAYAKAKAAGDTAGMAAAASKGAELRSQNGVVAAFNSKAGVTTFGDGKNAANTDVLGNAVNTGNAGNSTVTNDLSSFKDSQTGLINQIYDNQKSSQLQQIKDQRDMQIQGLNKVNTQAVDSATAQRSQVAAADIQAGQRLKEAMAGMGLTNSGDNLTATGNQNTVRQNAMGQVNQNLAQIQQDVEERKTLINNAAAANNMALLQKLQADQSRDMLQLGYQADDRNFRNNQFGWQQTVDTANLTGNFNDHRTLQGQQYDSNQTQQDWQNKFTYGQATGTFGNGQQTLEKMVSDRNFNYQVGRDTVGDKRYQTEFDNRVKQDGLQNAISWYSAQTSRNNSSWAQDPSNPDNLYKFAQIDKLNNPASSYNGMNANQIYDGIRSAYTEQVYGPPDFLGRPGPKISEKMTTDPAKREEMFLKVVDSHLPNDQETYQVLSMLGLSKEEIEAYKKKYNGG